ncbi:NADPH-dependent FMN reductase [Xanthobacter versatilis]|uniref:NADPH-dependent FMN reductase n=1 Tax=Xanthobacter autotrophicus (strain ATCC BAA-1158 / Py2) TaxID=78245 RepID=UPI003728C834
MNWVVLVGSVRKGSLNAALARALPDLAPDGVKIDLLPSVADMPIYDGDIETAGFPGQVSAVGDRVKAADSLVIVTPEYNYSVPGGLKNALDWLSRLKTQPLKGKPTLIMSASPSTMGGARAQYHLRQVLVAVDAHVMNVPEVMVAQAHTKITDGVLTDQGTRDFVGKQLSAFHGFVKQAQATA